ncbi:MAG: hypothetical protein ACO3CD_06405 [Candidatus Nanopelagicaceae bacterium]
MVSLQEGRRCHFSIPWRERPPAGVPLAELSTGCPEGTRLTYTTKVVKGTP